MSKLKCQTKSQAQMPKARACATRALGHWDLSHLFVIGILTLGFDLDFPAARILSAPHQKCSLTAT